MIREDRFLVSRRPYALDMSTFTLVTRTPDPDKAPPYHSWSVDALWFRRRDGVTQAALGGLSESVRGECPASPEEALRRSTDGRYGGSWVARWNGKDYVSEVPQSPEAMAAHLAILRPMLENYPALPAGHEGWWRFETSAELREMREK